MGRLPTADETAHWDPVNGSDLYAAEMEAAKREPDVRLPRADDAERYCIGCLVKFPNDAGKLFELLTATDFFDTEHQKIFAAAQRQFVDGGIDPVLLGRAVGEASTLVDLGINPHNAPATAALIPVEAAKIVEARRKRQIYGIAEAAVHGALNGRMATDVVRTLVADLDDYRREATTDGRLLSDLMTASEFVRQDHRVEYLIPYIIVAGQPGIISARAKSLKTTVAIDANISMATATPFLGHWEVPHPVRCGILTAESGAATISETITRIAASKGVHTDELDYLTVSTRCPKLQSQDWLDEIRDRIIENEWQCLTIDPTYLALAGIDQNKLAAVACALGPVGEIIRETGCTILMVHHNRKVTPAPYGCPTLEEITGSGFAEWSRFWLLLNRRREWDDEQGRHWLWFVSGGSAGFGTSRWLDVREGKPTNAGGRVWKVDVLSASEGESQEREQRDRDKEQKQSEQLTAEITKVCQFMAKYPNGTSKTFVRERCGVSGRRFPALFQAMYEAEQIVDCKVKVGNKKKMQPGFKLNTEAT